MGEGDKKKYPQKGSEKELCGGAQRQQHFLKPCDLFFCLLFWGVMCVCLLFPPFPRSSYYKSKKNRCARNVGGLVIFVFFFYHPHRFSQMSPQQVIKSPLPRESKILLGLIWGGATLTLRSLPFPSHLGWGAKKKKSKKNTKRNKWETTTKKSRHFHFSFFPGSAPTLL